MQPHSLRCSALFSAASPPANAAPEELKSSRSSVSAPSTCRPRSVSLRDGSWAGRRRAAHAGDPHADREPHHIAVVLLAGRRRLAPTGQVQIRPPAGGDVRTVDAYAAGTVNGNPRQHFSATVTGLDPATAYEYRVGLDGGWSDGRSSRPPIPTTRSSSSSTTATRRSASTPRGRRSFGRRRRTHRTRSARSMRATSSTLRPTRRSGSTGSRAWPTPPRART